MSRALEVSTSVAETTKTSYIYSMDSKNEYTVSSELVVEQRNKLSNDDRTLLEKIYLYTVNITNSLKNFNDALSEKKVIFPAQLYHIKNIRDKKYLFDKEEFKIGDILELKHIVSTTYSLNYPLLGSFSEDVISKMNIQREMENINLIYNLENIKNQVLDKDLIGLFKKFIRNKGIDVEVKEEDATNVAESIIDVFLYIKNRYNVKLLRDFSNYVIDEKIEKLRIKSLCCVLIFVVKNGGFIAKEFSSYPEQYEVLIERGRRFVVEDIGFGELKQSALSLSEGNKRYIVNDIPYLPEPHFVYRLELQKIEEGQKLDGIATFIRLKEI